MLSAALRSVATDSSTLPLSPYLTQFVVSEVNSNLRCLPRLQGAMRLTQVVALHAVVHGFGVFPDAHVVLSAFQGCAFQGRWSLV